MTTEITNARSRDDHVKWCKARALEYLNNGDLQNAIASMLSDMSKHSECRVNPALSAYGIMCVANNDFESVRRFIEGFR